MLVWLVLYVTSLVSESCSAFEQQSGMDKWTFLVIIPLQCDAAVIVPFFIFVYNIEVV